MATRAASTTPRAINYPTSDGRPLGETDDHRNALIETVLSLEFHFAADPLTYVSGNMLVFYVPGDKRRHLSPDVFVVRGVDKHTRDNYLAWEEGKGPDCVIELTSPSTRREDLTKKFEIYRDILLVQEYFLFDPKSQYLDPRLQGHRLVDGRYEPIEWVAGRVPSVVLGLHLEGVGRTLRLFDPAPGVWLPTSKERELAQRRSEEARRQAEEAWRQAEEDRRQAEEDRRRAEEDRRQAEEGRQETAMALQRSEDGRRQAESDAERLRQELEELRRRLLP